MARQYWWSEELRALTQEPKFEHGFWWWFDIERSDWFVGPAPGIAKPPFKII